MKLSKLPNWKKLTKAEQARLKEVYQPDYENVLGKQSISSQELKKAKKTK